MRQRNIKNFFFSILKSVLDLKLNLFFFFFLSIDLGIVKDHVIIKGLFDIK